MSGVKRSPVIFILNFAERVISSAGLEHYLDKVGVIGSIPVSPTIKEAE
jgi:hypothetical protein